MPIIVNVLLTVTVGLLLVIPIKIFILGISWENTSYDFVQHLTVLIAIPAVYFFFFLLSSTI